MAQSREKKNRKARDAYHRKKKLMGVMSSQDINALDSPPGVTGVGSPITGNDIPTASMIGPNVQSSIYDSFLEDIQSKTGMNASWVKGAHGRVLSVSDSEGGNINITVRLETSSPLGVVPVVGGRESNGQTITEGGIYGHTLEQIHRPAGKNSKGIYYPETVSFRMASGTQELATAITNSFLYAGGKGHKGKSPQEVFDGITADVVRRNEEHLTNASKAGLSVPNIAKRRLFDAVTPRVTSDDIFYQGQKSNEDLDRFIYGNLSPTYIDEGNTDPATYQKDVAEQNRYKEILREGAATYNGGKILIGYGYSTRYAGTYENTYPLGGKTTFSPKIHQVGSQVEARALSAIRKKGKIIGYEEAPIESIVDEKKKPLWAILNYSDKEGYRGTASIHKMAFVPLGFGGGAALESANVRVPDAYGSNNAIVRTELETMSPLGLAKADIRFLGEHSRFGKSQMPIATIDGEKIMAPKNKNEFWSEIDGGGIIEIPAFKSGDTWSMDAEKGQSTDEDVKLLEAKGHTVRQIYNLTSPRLVQRGSEIWDVRNKGEFTTAKSTFMWTGADQPYGVEYVGGDNMKTAAGFKGIWGAMTNKQQLGLVKMWASEKGGGPARARVLAELQAQVGEEQGVGTSPSRLAAAGGFKGGEVQFLQSLFGMVSESSGDVKKQKRIAEIAGFSYVQSAIYNAGPWSQEHYDDLKADFTAVRQRRGMSNADIETEFNKTYQRGQNKEYPNNLFVNVDFPHLIADSGVSKVGDPSSFGNLSGLFLNEMYRKYPQASKALGLRDGVRMTVDQMASAGLLKYVMDQTDIDRGKSVSSREVTREEAIRIQNINQGRETAEELSGVAFANAVQEILPDVGIGDTMRLNGELFPSAAAIAGKQWETETASYGAAARWQKALNFGIEQMLLPEDERIYEKQKAAEANRQTPAQWSAMDMFTEINRSSGTLLKSLKSIETAGASWTHSAAIRKLGIHQVLFGENINEADAIAYAKQYGVPLKEARKAIHNVHGVYASRQANVAALSAVSATAFMEGMNRKQKASFKAFTRRHASTFFIGSSLEKTDFLDLDLDPLTILRDLLPTKNGDRMWSLSGGLAPHGKQAGAMLQATIDRILTPKLQEELLSGQKEAVAFMERKDPIAKLTKSSETMLSYEAIEKADAASRTGYTSASAWYGTNAAGSADAIEGEATDRQESIAFVNLGIDKPSIGSSDLSSMLSSSRITTDAEGNMRLQYSTSKKVNKNSNAKQTNRYLELSGGNVAKFGVRNFMRKVVMDATSPFNNEVVATPEYLAKFFGRNKDDARELEGILKSTDRSDWTRTLVDRVNESYSGLIGDEITDMDSQWIGARGPSSMIAIAMNKNRRGEVEDYGSDKKVSAGVDKFIGGLSNFLSGGNKEKASKLTKRFTDIATHLQLSRNFKNVAQENRPGTSDVQQMLSGNSIVDDTIMMAMKRAGIVAGTPNLQVGETPLAQPRDYPRNAVILDSPEIKRKNLTHILNNPETPASELPIIRAELGKLDEAAIPSKNNVPSINPEDILRGDYVRGNNVTAAAPVESNRSIVSPEVVESRNAAIPRPRTEESKDRIRIFDKMGNTVVNSMEKADWLFLQGQGSGSGGAGNNRTEVRAGDMGRPNPRQRNITYFSDRQLNIAQRDYLGAEEAHRETAQRGMDRVITRLETAGITLPRKNGRVDVSKVPRILGKIISGPDSDLKEEALAIIAEAQPAALAGKEIEEKAANLDYAESRAAQNATVLPIMYKQKGYWETNNYQVDLALGGIKSLEAPAEGKRRNELNELRLKEGRGRAANIYSVLASRGLIAGPGAIGEDEWRKQISLLPKEGIAEMGGIAERVKAAIPDGVRVSREQRAITDLIEEAKRTNPAAFKDEKQGRVILNEEATKRLVNAYVRLNKATTALVENTERLEKGESGLNEKKVKALQIQQKQAELDIRAESIKSNLASGRTRFMELTKRQASGKRLTLDEEKEQAGWYSKEKTMNTQLGEIAGQQEELSGKNQWGKFARRMLGGFGLMYLRSIYGVATQGWGYGQAETQQMEQIGAQGAYGATNIPNVPYNQQQQLSNAMALYGSRINPQSSIDKFMAQNAPLRDIKNAAATGIGTWGLMQYAGGELGGTAGALLKNLSLPLAVGMVGIMAASEVGARSEDPTATGQRIGRTLGGASGLPGIYDMAAAGWLGLTNPKEARKMVSSFTQTQTMEQGYANGKSMGEIFGANPLVFASQTDKYTAMYQSILSNNPNISPEAASQTAVFALRTPGVSGQSLAALANDFQMGGKNIQAGMGLTSISMTSMAHVQGEITATIPQEARKIEGFSVSALPPKNPFAKYDPNTINSAQGIYNGEYIKSNGDGTWTLPDGTIVDKDSMTKGDPNAKVTGERSYVYGLLANEAASGKEPLITPKQLESFGAAKNVLSQLSSRAKEAYGISKEPATAQEIADIIIKYGSVMASWNEQKQQNFLQTANSLAQLTPGQLKAYGGRMPSLEEIKTMGPGDMAVWQAQSASTISAAKAAENKITALTSPMKRFGNTEVANKLDELLTNLNEQGKGGEGDFILNTLSGKPLNMALLANGARGVPGINLGNLPGIRDIQGNTMSANYLAFTDVNEKGQLTGMQWGSSTLKLGSESAEQVGANIFGPNPSKYAQAAISGYKLDQPIDTGRKDANGNPILVSQVAGIRAAQWTYEDDMYSYQMQGLGLQQQSMNLGWAHTQAQWKIRDKQIALSNWYQTQQFGLQQEQINQSKENIGIGNAIQQQQMTLTRSWAKEDWGYQDQTRNMQWGWKQEDFAEESRFMTGRQRKLAERQMGRETTLHNLETDQIDKTRARQEELWKLEDQRFDLQKKQQIESLEMQQKQLDLQRKYFEEQKKLRAQQIAEERKYQKEQQKIQQEQLNLQKKQAEATRQLALDTREWQTYIQAVGGQMNLLTEEGMAEFSAAMDNILKKVRELYDITVSDPAQSSSGGSSGGSSDDSSDDSGGRFKPYLVSQQAQNFPYGQDQTERIQYQTGDTSYFFKSGKTEKQQNISIYIGNEHLSRFVLDAVTKELRT